MEGKDIKKVKGRRVKVKGWGLPLYSIKPKIKQVSEYRFVEYERIFAELARNKQIKVQWTAPANLTSNI